jgi:hypothetical protein
LLAAARVVDAAVLDRLLPAAARHTVTGTLRP